MLRTCAGLWTSEFSPQPQTPFQYLTPGRDGAYVYLDSEAEADVMFGQRFDEVVAAWRSEECQAAIRAYVERTLSPSPRKRA